MALSRRALFRKTGAAIAALGLAEAAVNLSVGNRANAYAQSLTGQSKGGRKLALLIGVDTYPRSVLAADSINANQPKLQGCATDVALQRELLVHRFGFLPADIVCLTNEQATRAGIYKAFVEHLYDQAESGDVVVVHFSGYGARGRFTDADDANNASLNGSEVLRSLVPINGFFPQADSLATNDILEIELKSLLKLLKTKQITTVIDAGFVDLPVPLSGGLRSRARATVAESRAPSAFPLLADKRLAKESDPFPGTLLRGADLNDAVLERPWDGFSAGAFTYVLTQYLWSVPEVITTEQALGRSQETLMRWGGSNQQPDGTGSAAKPEKPVYNAALLESSRGSGVIQSVDGGGQRATLWLGGLPPRVLEYMGPESTMTCGGRRLKIQSHNQLLAQARLVDSADSGAPLHVGQGVQESVRVLPKNTSLVVALDSRLERIERVDATSALSALAFVKSTSGTDLPADCLLGKPITPSAGVLIGSKRLTGLAQGETEFKNPMKTAEQLGYGLFSLTRSLIPDTLAQQDEAINPAIARLAPKLRALLALKMLRLSENRAVSQLPVRAVMEMVAPEEKLLVARQTIRLWEMRSGGKRLAKSDEGMPTPQVPIGSRVRYRLFNESDRPLYYTLITVNPRERLSAFCPSMEGSSGEGGGGNSDGMEMSAIAPGSSVVIPSPDLDWAVDSSAGPVETYVVCSVKPLKRTFEALLVADPGGSGQRISPLPEPLTVMEALLSDISQPDSPDEYRLKVSDWATLNFTYQAV